MLMIPFQINAEEFSVFVILEPENTRRMRDNDPAQINLWKMPAPYSALRLRDVILATPTPQDAAKAMRMADAGNVQAAMEYLSRGFKFKPKEGDDDLPYQRSRTQ